MTNRRGLTNKQVADRRAKSLINQVDDETSRTIGDILRGNVLTPFNGLITMLAIVMTLVNKSPINSLFFVAMILNIVVGVTQELKAKVTLDRLSIMVKPKVRVIRDNHETEIDASEVVQDDWLVLAGGDQVVVDGVVVESAGLEINESLLTGEADPVAKATGDEVMSGSLVVGGSGVVRATCVGNQSYSARLAREAKQFKRASSELVDSTNIIMTWIARILLVVAPILVIGQMRISNGDWSSTITHTVAAIVGMIPEGLVLLTSMAFLLAVIKLARQQVLVQQLPAVETLARVNVLLLDKTGTITSGEMKLQDIIYLGGEQPSADEGQIRSILATMAGRNVSSTNEALAAGLTDTQTLPIDDEVPFNSQRKWSAIKTDNHNYILGAPEIVASNDQSVLDQVNDLASQGYRVLLLATTKRWPDERSLSGDCLPLALVVFAERIRDDAARTLQYFADQGVEIKIISGDSPQTVSAVASQVGLKATTVDARNLPSADDSPEDFAEAVQQHNVFGRVRPEQKRQIAAALQARGNVVAMTGDGVNDALALKKADLGIAMNSGTSATKSVAEVVLLDDKFSHLPAVLGEGRRVVANIERVSNLFIIKNIYSLVLSLAVTVMGMAYPFMPAQMTVISSLSIGIPAFFLALAPNSQRYRPGFLKRVLSFAIPAGFTIGVSMLIGYYLIDSDGMDLTTAGTSVTIVTMLIGLAVLVLLARPIKGWKLTLIASCGGVFSLFVLWQPLAKLFSFHLDWATIPTVAIIGSIATIIIIIIRRLSTKLTNPSSHP